MLGYAPSRPICALPEWRAFVYSTTAIVAEDSLFTRLYAATLPFITRAGDTLPNQPFLGTLEGSLRVDRSIVGSDGYGGYAQNVSELSLINADGEYDDADTESGINGQEIVCRIGEVLKNDPHGVSVVAPYSQFETIALLIGERWYADRSRLTVELRDHAARLDVPVQTSKYAGTGELEGGTEIANQSRPYGDGVVFNATPTLVIAAEAVWQCNGGAVFGVDAVKDGGIELTFTADHATVALLRAATLVPGQWASCNAQGYFRLGGAAVAQVTVDFTGLNLTTANIIEAAALAATDLTASDLDAWTFEKLNTDQPASVVYYLDSASTETCAEMFTKLMRGVGGWWQMTTLAKLQVHRFEAPVAIAAEYYDLNGGNLIDINRGNLPAGIDPPPRRRRVAYARNWTIQTQLYGQVSEDDPALAEYLGKPYKVASTPEALSNAILADYPFAPDPPVDEGYFVEEAPALAEGTRKLLLYSSGLRPYQMTAKNALLIHQVGQVVNARDSSPVPRLGLGAGKYLRLVEVNDNTRDGTTTMIGFG